VATFENKSGQKWAKWAEKWAFLTDFLGFLRLPVFGQK
jgi:hypothetical protein